MITNIQINEKVLTPEQVRKEFPNALLVPEYKRFIDQAEQNKHHVHVYFYDAIWGRTAVAFEEEKHS